MSAQQQSRDARWRFQRHNGEWWYYSPENNWMYHRGGQWNTFAQDSYTPPAGVQLSQQASGQYTAGYRGQAGANASAGTQQTYTLHTDGSGQQYIIDGGRRLYINSDASTSASLNGQTGADASASTEMNGEMSSDSSPDQDASMDAGATVDGPAGTDADLKSSADINASASENGSAGIDVQQDADANLSPSDSTPAQPSADVDSNANISVDPS
ncbi:MAG: hypothetical protein CMJ58_05795 [Planctomycetaceae bacterium]|nr:hypothetical protein [Planctomycetaceae bacterium]